jgi:hypothetical protein
MGTENRQLNRKKVVGLILCVVLVIILAGFIQTLLASASSSGSDKATLTPIAGQQSGSAASTTTAKAASTAYPTKVRIATATPNPASTANPAATSTTASATQPPVTGGSPLLFGTNLSLQDSSDQVLTSATTRSLLQQIHVKLVRIPTRSNLSDATVMQAAQIAQSLGAVPLIILQGDQSDNTALQDDTSTIQAMNKVFGNSTVYYEYGNEEDFTLQLTAQSYTASWNRVVPQLKKVALNGHFVGPVNYQYDASYLQYFLQNAKPLPTEVSWHEYACASNWTNDICMSHIDNWTNHFASARSIMNATLGTTLPIMITEWNYTANPVSGDGKSDNNAFMTAWTTKALQNFAANGIFAAAQFSCTDYTIPLVDSNDSLTAQGQAFQKEYAAMVGG